MFTNGSGDRISIPGRVIPKTQKVVLDTFLLDTPTPWKGNLRVTHNYGYQDFLFFLLYWLSESNVRQWSGRPSFNPRSSHTKDSKMVFDTFLLDTQHYNGKVEQSRERCCTLSYTLKRGTFGLPSTTVANFPFFYMFEFAALKSSMAYD